VSARMPAPWRASMQRLLLGTALSSVATVASGCYEARPVDARAVWQEAAPETAPAVAEVAVREPAPAPSLSSAPAGSSSVAPMVSSAAPSSSVASAPAWSPSSAPKTLGPLPPPAVPPAQPRPPAEPGWAERALRVSADEAAARALRDNPVLRALRAQSRKAEGAAVTAKTLANPVLELDWLHIQSVSYEKAWAAELSWVPPQPGVWGGRRRAATSDALAAGHDVEELAFSLEVDVRAAHADLLALSKKRALTDEACARRQEIVNLVTRRMAAGASTRIDLSLAELALTQMQAARDDLLAAELEKSRLLASLMGVASDVQAAGDDLPEVPAAPSLDALGAAAFEARPALKAEQARLTAREEELGATRAAAWPWLKLGGRYRSNETREHADDWAASVQIALPLFDRLQGPRAAATAARDQQESTMRGVASGVWRDLAFARAQLDLRRENAARFKVTVVDTLPTREAQLSTAARGGQLDVVAWLTAEDVITRSRQTYVDLRLAETRAWLALERALGRHVTRTKNEHEGGSS